MTSSSSSIQKLPTEVINRIAAGEVVQRPSAALKELVENSLDAGSTSISVSVRDGGLDVLQVVDDGSGVRYADLPLLCERYATSKLRSFDDLQAIASFGFRGEALASVSYVARVTVVTRRREVLGEETREQDSRVAWRCRYMDGKLIDKPQPCAGNPGTTIRAEKMFYNAGVRRAALKPAEEWRRVLDVVSRYALAFPHVGFSCQKEGGGAGGGGGGDGLVFPRNSTTLDNIRLLLGNKVASHLRFFYYYNVDEPVQAEDEPVDEPQKGSPIAENNEVVMGESLSALVTHDPLGTGAFAADAALPSSSLPCTSSVDLPTRHANQSVNPVRRRREDAQADIATRVRAAARRTQALSGVGGDGRYCLMGYTSDATLLSRKPFLTLFVNHRLVESASVRRTIDMVYSSALTGGNRPTTVLFITVPSDRLDVNVHPTKKEVCFLDEELVLGRLTELIRAALVEAAAERQVDVTSLGKATTMALQSSVRLGSGGSALSPSPNDNADTSGSGLRQHGEGASALPHSNNSAVRGLMSFQQRQEQPTPRRLSGPAVVPSTVVRVEPQRGALDAFLQPKKSIKEEEQETGPATGTPVRVKTEPSPHQAPCATSEAVQPPASPSVDWASVLASVKPALDEDEMQPRLAQRGHEIKDGNASHLPEVHHEGVLALPTTAHMEGTDEVSGSLAASTIMHPRGTHENNSGVQGSVADEDDDDLADAMREFKRFKQETETRSGPVANQEPPRTQLAAVPSSHVLDEDESSNSVQVVADPSGSAGADGTAAESGGQLVGFVEWEDHVLSSVVAVVQDIGARTNDAVQSFFASLTFVGVCDAHMFLAQSGTSLLAVDTLRLVRAVVFQRVFLRWAQPSLPRPPMVSFTQTVPSGNPTQTAEKRPHAVNVFDAMTFALYHDWAGAAACLDARSPLMATLQEALTAPSSSSEGRQERGSRAGGHAVSAALEAASPLHGADEGREDVASGETEGPRQLSPLQRKLLARIPELLFLPPDANGSTDTATTTAASPRPTRSCRRYVRSLVRRLDRWRDMLEDYFGICINAAGHLTAIPCGLNPAWPPTVRALPLFLWLLAETVPFPEPRAVRALEEASERCTSPKDRAHRASPHEAAVEAERECFVRVARLIADVLYGLTVEHLLANKEEDSIDGHADTHASDPVKSEGQTRHATITPSQRAALTKAIQFGLFPCLKSARLFIPPVDMLSDGTVQSVVTVESLYKVFERC